MKKVSYTAPAITQISVVENSFICVSFRGNAGNDKTGNDDGEGGGGSAGWIEDGGIVYPEPNPNPAKEHVFDDSEW